MKEESFESLRQRMVEKQISNRGIKDCYVLHAMRTVPRHLFVAENNKQYAYEDYPLVIGYGQTISQPYIVALMTELLQLRPEDKVLEIGAGCGYQSAILALMVEQVISIERIPELAELARNNLEKAGIINVDVHVGDGSNGYPEDAPYDRIVVTAASPTLPLSYIDQLVDGGRVVIPVGGESHQDLHVYVKTGSTLQKSSHGGCRFVKLIGEQAWEE